MMMPPRIACFALTALGFSNGGCALFEARDFPCELTGTCTPPPDAAMDSAHDAAPAADVGPDKSDGSSNLGSVDAGPDVGSFDGATDDANTEGGNLTDASSPDSSDATECDATRSPYDAPCVIDEPFGVFVAPTANSTAAADGTRAHPFTTLAEGLRRAQVAVKRVYVCDDGTGYTGPVSIGPSADGVKLFGGFECSGWTYSTTRRAKLAAPSSPVLTIAKLAAGIAIEDFEIVAPDASNPGESSIGVVASESAGVVLRRVKVTAGKGKDGTNGQNGGGPGNEQALAGSHGSDGAKACSANPNLGGVAVTTMCTGVASSTGASGGNGAPNAVSKGGAGDDGSPPYAAGKAGIGEPVTGSWDCGLGRGQDGSNGPDGPLGSNATGLGTLTSDGWKGIAGIDGTAGQPGQGGGGGGGAKAPMACTAVDGGSLSPTGASGGSGGGGGCGGDRRQGRHRRRLEHRAGLDRVRGHARLVRIRRKRRRQGRQRRGRAARGQRRKSWARRRRRGDVPECLRGRQWRQRR